MTVITDQLKFIGLNDREVRVFTALSTFGRMNMTKISSRAGLSRTTVDAIVRRLVGQGLVVQEKVAGHFEYTVKLHEVADRLDWIEQRLRPSLGSDSAKATLPSTPSLPPPCKGGGAPLPLPEGEMSLGQRGWEPLPGGMRSAGSTPQERGWESLPEGSLIVGHTTMHEMIEREFVTHAGERATMLLASLVTSEKRMKRFEHCLDHARRARMKLEILTTTDVSKNLSLHATEILALLTAYDLRLNFMPPSFCIENTDMIAFRDLIIVINQHSEVAECVCGAGSVAVVNHLLRVAREIGWGMDMKMWLEGIIASQKLVAE